ARLRNNIGHSLSISSSWPAMCERANNPRLHDGKVFVCWWCWHIIATFSIVCCTHIVNPLLPQTRAFPILAFQRGPCEMFGLQCYGWQRFSFFPAVWEIPALRA